MLAVWDRLLTIGYRPADVFLAGDSAESFLPASRVTDIAQLYLDSADPTDPRA